MSARCQRVVEDAKLADASLGTAVEAIGDLCGATPA
jgi:hypothetical protein